MSLLSCSKSENDNKDLLEPLQGGGCPDGCPPPPCRGGLQCPPCPPRPTIPGEHQRP
ncbi:unnamed protein product [Larinioides sclopetarius]|uniref:Uncharacterized protein n=1 Tax=Larinioides sclopetarius TaxID=280406 RepID=A0AAV2AHK2_9ARAC